MKKAIAAILPLMLIAFACATISTPMGGPKDELPPKLVRSSPDSGQRNFKGKNIELTFNEMLQLNNPKEEIIITPPVGKKTDFKLKDNRVVIEPEFDLRENTTYTISFREGIKDITEGNVAEDLHLAFSTGPVLDSLYIEGTVRNALVEKIPENITVAIYEADTFDIMRHTPEYFTKSTKAGDFRITHLKPGTYRIYAFQDKNKNLKLDSQSELFGFSANPIELTTHVKRIAIALVKVDSRNFKFTSVRNLSSINTIRLNKPATAYSLKSTQPILSTFGSTQSEIIAYYPDINPDAPEDSTKVSFTAIDSVAQKIDTMIYIKRDKRANLEEPFRTATSDPKFITETGQLEFTATFSKPIKAFTQDSLYLESDTATFIPLKIANIKIDTMHRRLTYSQVLTYQDSLIAPSLRVGKGFFISIDGDSSKPESRKLDVRTLANSSTLLVEVQTKHPHYIVEVVDANDNVVASSINTPKPVFKYLEPKTYRVRVIIDTNNNGKWDTANYLQNSEPERAVYYINSDKKTEIPLRANWEVGPNVIKL
jgi:uncharacterized protein (DUF2141 family)